MMKLALLFLSSAAAFAPSAKTASSSSSALHAADYSKEVGAMTPVRLLCCAVPSVCVPISSLFSFLTFTARFL